MHIAVLTGGGDVPGLNPCIKALVVRADQSGHKVTGIRRGWAGLLCYNPDDARQSWRHAIPLDTHAVRRVDRTGGTFLHTSRTNPANVPADKVPDFLRGDDWSPDQGRRDYTEHVLEAIEALGIDVLVSIGGDDTLSYAERLHREGMRVIGIPKTMDNDVFGTDYCIGFSTAVTRSVNFINQLRTSTGSHERIAVVELFGRNSGETSLIAAYLAGVDRAIISEVPFDPEKVSTLIMEDKFNNPSNYAMLTVSEGAHEIEGKVIETGVEDDYGHRKLGGIGAVLGEYIERHTGQNIIYQRLAYLMRSGAPDSLDLMVAANYAHVAMELIAHGKSGRMVALQRGVYTAVPISTVMKGVKRVDVDELYDTDQYKPRIRRVAGMPMFLS
jgi:6-phosphofructokinase 1